MLYADRVKYTATRVDDVTYNVTLVSGFRPVPDGQLTAFTIADDSGAFITCDGSITAGVFTVQHMLSSSSGANIPTFNGTIEIFSTASAERLNRSAGRAVVGIFGQSNAVGLSTGNDKRDYVWSPTTQWSRFYDQWIQAVEPLEHQLASINGADNVSFSTHFANALHLKGYSSIGLVPGGYGATGFSNGWDIGGGLYNQFVTDMSDAINADPDAYPVCFIMNMGNQDNDAGWTSTQYRNTAVAAVAQMRIDIGSNTGLDLSRTPLLVMGLNQEYLNGVSYNGQIEVGHSEIPDYLPYSAYLARPWSTTTAGQNDAVHDDAPTHRRDGMNELHPVLLSAQSNISPPNAPQDQDLRLNSLSTPQIRFVDLTATLTYGAEGTNLITVATPTIDFVDQTGNLNTSTGTSTPLTDALNVEVQYIKGVGLTDDGGGLISQWANQSPNFIGQYNATASGAARPTSEAGGLRFGSGIEMLMDATLVQDTTNGFTVFIEAYGVDVFLQTLFGNDDTFIGASSVVLGRAFGTTGGGFGNWPDNTLTTFTLVGDPVNDLVKAYVNGVENSSSDMTTTDIADTVLKLGAISSSNSTWAGLISNVVIKKAVLTPQQINDVISEFA